MVWHKILTASLNVSFIFINDIYLYSNSLTATMTTGWLLNNGEKSKWNEEAVTYFKVQSLHLPEEMKNHKDLHQNNQFSGHGLKQGPPEYERVLIIQWRYIS
jgi:hypothetical protein